MGDVIFYLVFLSFHSLEDIYDIEENALDWSAIYRLNLENVPGLLMDKTEFSIV